MNATHDPSRRSWIESANDPDTDFPIQNLPFGVFSRHGRPRSVGVAIGSMILDLTACGEAGLLEQTAALECCSKSSLNQLMNLSSDELSALRAQISSLLTEGSEAAQRAPAHQHKILVGMGHATLHLPAEIGDYTDFYASVSHATNVGSMFRPDNPLLPNYKYVPIGYHGRASSIVPSGTPVRRPAGQTKAQDAAEPSFGPSKMLDYESELGFYIGRGNDLGAPIRIDEAAQHIFGFTLVNDWSARDIQAWEYQPLGPFLAKNFATTVSPWVLTLEAAEPYRTSVPPRPDGDPQPLAYLHSDADQKAGAFSVTLEVYLSSAKMRSENIPPVLLSRAPFRNMYWTAAQMLAHHASNGCNLRSGDLLASGTVSGDDERSRGCLLELTWRGSKPLTLPTGEERKFLADGDEVLMKGYLEADGRPRLGFGECRGTILPTVGS
jgi:fumarylacetoacetase